MVFNNPSVRSNILINYLKLLLLKLFENITHEENNNIIDLNIQMLQAEVII